MSKSAIIKGIAVVAAAVATYAVAKKVLDDHEKQVEEETKTTVEKKVNDIREHVAQLIKDKAVDKAKEETVAYFEEPNTQAALKIAAIPLVLGTVLIIGDSIHETHLRAYLAKKYGEVTAYMMMSVEAETLGNSIKSNQALENAIRTLYSIEGCGTSIPGQAI